MPKMKSSVHHFIISLPLLVAPCKPGLDSLSFSIFLFLLSGFHFVRFLMSVFELRLFIQMKKLSFFMILIVLCG